MVIFGICGSFSSRRYANRKVINYVLYFSDLSFYSTSISMRYILILSVLLKGTYIAKLIYHNIVLLAIKQILQIPKYNQLVDLIPDMEQPQN